MASLASTSVDKITHAPKLRQIIFKIAQRCNINCTYCYVYNMGDDSWRAREKFASQETVVILASRIKEHIELYKLPFAHLELHGGEPLLYGKKNLRTLLTTMISTIGANQIKFSLQTNGILLDEEWVDLFDEFSVSVGISIDGPPSITSQRVDKHGKDTTPRLVKVLESLRASRPNFRPGALTVISDATDVCELIRWFPSIGINSFDLLFPLGNVLTAPIGITSLPKLTKNLIDGFEAWKNVGRSAPRIRLYELMLEGLLGYEIVLDSLGGDLSALCVVESNGAIGMNDVTRFLGGKYSQDELNIKTDRLDCHARHFDISSVQRLCEKCRSCEVVNACGGGYLPDRFNGVSFSNPTYYCNTMYELSQHLLRFLQASVPSTACKMGVDRGR